MANNRFVETGVGLLVQRKDSDQIEELVKPEKKVTKLEDRVLILRDKVDSLALDKAFNPDQKRDERGRWIESAEARVARIKASLKESEEQNAKYAARVLIRANEVVKKLNYRGSVSLKKGAETGGFGGMTSGHYNNRTGEITLFPYVLSTGELITKKKIVEGVIAHEVMHGKFNTVMTQYHAEKDVAQVLGQEAYPDGSKLPVLAAMHEVYTKQFSPKGLSSSFQKEGGVSRYSNQFWKDYKGRGETSVKLAINETLAEMSSIHYRTGKLVGGPSFKALYKTVNDLYHKIEWENLNKL